VRHRQRLAFSIDRSRRSPQTQTMICSHAVIHSPIICRFNGLHPHISYKCMDYYSFTDPRGMECWVGWVGWAIADSLPTKWSPINLKWNTGQRAMPPIIDVHNVAKRIQKSKNSPHCWQAEGDDRDGDRLHMRCIDVILTTRRRVGGILYVKWYRVKCGGLKILMPIRRPSISTGVNSMHNSS